MTSPSWENLDDFLQLDADGGFATTASITLQGGGVLSVVGIFDDPYMNAQLGEYETDASSPRFTVKESSVAGVRRGAVAVINGRTYAVMHDPESDGVGMAILRLQPE